jgi:pentachlorophenol monooxygenase/3-(3-hydroxy-phenyl)propionate hydroxylase
VLLAEGADRIAAEAAAGAVGAPVRVAALDPTAAAALGARPGEAWVVRPDAHVAAVVMPADLERALRRALGHPTEGAHPCRTTTAAVTSPRSATPSTADPTGASTPRS